MSTTPIPRQPARATSQTPSTTDSTSPSIPSSTSYSVEPKSEYLRNVLEARRARNNTPTPSPIEPPLRRRATSTASVDPWLDQAESEKDAPHIIPIRRVRRPSEGATPRMRTQRELQTETESLKATMFNINLKLELLKQQNNELKDQMDEANKRIEELEPLEDENIELRADNNRMMLKMQDMEEEIMAVRDANMQILQIQDDAVAELEQRNAALEEAADMIFKLDNDKAQLREENSRLRKHIASSLTTPGEIDYYITSINGNAKDKYPSRISSIDDSRPSTSHTHSDYYSQSSQPPSPHVKARKHSPPYSERAKEFLAMNISGKRSLQDLKKRVSDVSLRNTPRPSSPIPEVPQIPQNLLESHQLPQRSKSSKRLPRSHQAESRLPLLNTRQQSPAKAGAAPRNPKAVSPGLRHLYQEKARVETPSRYSRPSSSYTMPLASKGSHSSDADLSQLLTPPLRHSSRHATPPGSSEHVRSSSSLKSETEASEWASMPPPMDTEDLTSVVDPKDRDRWWKDAGDLASGVQRATSFGPSTRSSRSKALRGSSVSETDFLFNGAEDEDQFMKRTHQYVSKRRER